MQLFILLTGIRLYFTVAGLMIFLPPALAFIALSSAFHLPVELTKEILARTRVSDAASILLTNSHLSSLYNHDTFSEVLQRAADIDLESIQSEIRRTKLNRTVMQLRKHKYLSPLELACLYGNVKAVREILATIEDPMIEGTNLPLQYAISNRNEEIVDMLLADERVDPSVTNQIPVRIACGQNNPRALQALLSDHRVDPTVVENYCVRYAVSSEFADNLRILVQHPSIDPNIDDGVLLRNAAIIGNAEILQILLSTNRIDPSAFNQAAVTSAAAMGHLDAVAMLLKDSRVSVYAAMTASMIHGQVNIVRYLMKNETIDHNVVLFSAVMNNQDEIIDVLLKEFKVPVEDSLRTMSSMGQIDIMMRILHLKDFSEEFMN